MAINRIGKTFDILEYVHDGTALTASASGTVGGAAAVIDLGSGFVDAELVLDVSALDVDTGNEVVTVQIKISDTEIATQKYTQTQFKLGDSTVNNCDVDRTTGRYLIPFNNMIETGQCLRYAHVYFLLAGTIAAFTATGYFVKK